MSNNNNSSTPTNNNNNNNNNNNDRNNNNDSGHTSQTNDPSNSNNTLNEGRPGEEPLTFNSGTNVIVAINYVLQNDRGAAANPQNNDTSAAAAAPGPAAPGPANANNENGAANNNETVGSFYLNFTGLPTNTSPERFSQLMSIAANVALNRLSRTLNTPRRLKKDFFENLPIKKPEEVRGEVCSICYDDYVDNDEGLSPGNSKKRKLEDGETEDDHISLNSKRGKTNSNSNSNSNSSGSSSTEPQEETESDNEARAEDVPSTPSILTNGSVQGAQSPEPSGTPNTSIPITTEEQEGAQDARDGETDEEKKKDTEYKHCAVELPCHHIFGRSCICEWCKEHNTCPVCRAVVGTPDDLEPHQVNESIHNLGEDPTFEIIRRLLYEGADAVPATEGSPTTNAPATSNGSGTDTSTTGPSTNAAPPRNLPGLERLAALGAVNHHPSIIYLRRNRDGDPAAPAQNIPLFIRQLYAHNPTTPATTPGSDTSSNSTPHGEDAQPSNDSNSSNTNESAGTTSPRRGNTRGRISTLLRDLFSRSNMHNNTNNSSGDDSNTTTTAPTTTASDHTTNDATTVPIPTEEAVEANRAAARNYASTILDSIMQGASGSEPIAGQQGVASYRNSSGQVSTVNITGQNVPTTSSPDIDMNVSDNNSVYSTGNNDSTGSLVSDFNHIVPGRLRDDSPDSERENDNVETGHTNEPTVAVPADSRNSKRNHDDNGPSDSSNHLSQPENH